MRPFTHRDRHLDHAALVRQDGATAIFQFLHQTHNNHRIFDARDLTHEAPRNPDFLPALDVVNQDLRPGRFAEEPLVMLNVQDRGVEGERTRAKMLQRGRNGRNRHTATSCIIITYTSLRVTIDPDPVSSRRPSHQEENQMPVVFIETPPGIRVEAKKKMVERITTAIDEAYHFGDTLIFLREYPPKTSPW